uniref:Uncharacterized protein n=1 Tax=viral metagenome TaxID=1070528 RepID=A0A6M3L6E9_9ZZZZ
MKVRIKDHELYGETGLPRDLIGQTGEAESELVDSTGWGVSKERNFDTYKVHIPSQPKDPFPWFVPHCMIEFLED